MKTPESETIPMAGDALAGLLRSLQEEIRLLEPGKDSGLLPINSFLIQLGDHLGEKSTPASLVGALQAAQSQIDTILGETGIFTPESIQWFHGWHEWMAAAVAEWSAGKPVSAMPGSWNPPGSRVAVSASSAAEAAHNEPAADAAHGAAGQEAEPSLILNLQSDADLLGEFINESREHLSNLENGMLVLEEQPEDAETLNSVFRAFHTFKGGSGFLNLIPIKDLAHELESVLDAARQGRLLVDSAIISLLLEGGDTLRVFVDQIEAQLKGKDRGQSIVVPTLQLKRRIQALLATVDREAGPRGVSVAPAADLKDFSFEIPGAAPVAPQASNAAAAKQASKPADSEAPQPNGAVAEKGNGNGADAAAKKNGANGNGQAGIAGVVKVDTIKLDSLIDLVGELIISQSMVVQDRELVTLSSQHLVRNLAQLRRITTELQRTAMSLRMVPIRATFQKMTRLVRDLSSRQQKQMQLVFSGEETELDRNIVEALGDPLVHMIRNSVDHGLEMPDVRVQRGKPAMGTIELKAFHQGGAIVIQISDDGGGLNKERILKKAIQNGLVTPEQPLSDSEIYSLIFAPGFSTAEKVTDISGRGVGMDVVRRNIEKLRGKIDIETVEGKGTTFSIYLPLTLAIIDGMIVRVGSERFIIPSLAVRESFHPTASMISTIHGSVEMVNVRGRLSPLLRLHEFFNLTPTNTDPTKAIIVVVESGAKVRCLMVDELIGKQEVVIKNLGEAFKQNRALAGGAVLWDGRVGLILDVDFLVHLTPSMAFAG